jgi:hypothetical protein
MTAMGALRDRLARPEAGSGLRTSSQSQLRLEGCFRRIGVDEVVLVLEHGEVIRSWALRWKAKRSTASSASPRRDQDGCFLIEKLEALWRETRLVIHARDDAALGANLCAEPKKRW